MAIAITKPTSQVGDTSNLSVFSMSPAFTPAADSMLVVIAHASGTVTGSISGTGPAFSILGNVNPQALGNSARLLTAKTIGSGATTALNIDYTGDAATGACAVALQVAGLDLAYSPRQFVQVASVGPNPVLTFPLPTETGNAVIAGIVMGTSLGVFTPPAGWTTVSASYATPSTGLAVAHTTSINTTTITFSTGSAINLALFGVELVGNVSTADPMGMNGIFG